MRRLAILGLAMIGMAHSAVAADYDYPVLRGSQGYDAPPAYKDWSGFYIGGHIGYASANSDFGNQGSSQVANILRNTLLQEEFDVSSWLNPKASGNGTPFGLFMGYNWQSEDALFGFDLTYSHMSLSSGGSDSLARNVTTSDDTNYDVFVSATMAAKITDVLSLRGRGGVAIGNFLPYLTLGVAVGRVDLIQSASVTTVRYAGTPPLPEPPIFDSADDSRKGAYAYGASAGMGFDWAIFSNVFLRAEYEYVAFAPVQGVSLSIHTARAGLGAKF